MDSSIFSELRAGVITTAAEETRALAARLGVALEPSSVLALHGDLGAGKTTFVQGLAAGLGITESVTSPTFNIFTLHRGNGNTLVHVDAYRLDAGAQLEDLMIDDFLTPPWWLAVEWPGKVADWLPPHALHLELTHTADRRHSIRLR
jgi:tRNA threonylcarbamoyladenosine biosynthesis protein TsaE